MHVGRRSAGIGPPGSISSQNFVPEETHGIPDRDRDAGRQSVLTLHDDATGASASILPSYGFNLFDLRLPAGGRGPARARRGRGFRREPAGRGRATGPRSSSPIPTASAAPPSRFQGRTYKLPANNGPNAIHGFAVDAPWEVVEHKADADSAYVVGRYQISRELPADAGATGRPTPSLQVRYALAGRRLTMTITVSNPTAVDLPYGFGIHPYFRLPFAPGGDLGRTRVILPAAEYWVLEDFLPTGEIRPVDARLDFRAGQPMTRAEARRRADRPGVRGDRGVCRLVDLDKNAEFRLGFDRDFRELVVYTPPGRPDVISLEPYTQTTDAINLQARGVDAGLARPRARDAGHVRHHDGDRGMTDGRLAPWRRLGNSSDSRHGSKRRCSRL